MDKQRLLELAGIEQLNETTKDMTKTVNDLAEFLLDQARNTKHEKKDYYDAIKEVQGKFESLLSARISKLLRDRLDSGAKVK